MTVTDGAGYPARSRRNLAGQVEPYGFFRARERNLSKGDIKRTRVHGGCHHFQWRNKNSFELSSAHCTSSQALRLSAALATCSSAAFTSPAAGERERVAR